MIARAQHAVPSWLWILLLGLLALALLLSIATPAARMVLPGRTAPPAEASVTQLLADPAFREMAGESTPSLRLFYERRAFKPVWIDDPDSAALLRLTLAEAASQGLDPADYAVAELAPRPSTQEQVRHELRMTAALFRYAADLRTGRVTPSAVYRDARLPAQDFDAPSALQDAIAQNRFATFLADLAPPQPDYAVLRTALKTYRAIAAQGGWPAVPTGSAADLRGADPRGEPLRKRLAFEDPDVAATASEQQESDLVWALTRYQSRNGLEADGKLGPKTLAMLNISAGERAAQIVANMERWRWMPRNPENRRILVNAADASLTVLDGDETILSSRVIVGAPHTPTPIFHAVVTGILVNPPWNVPYSIASKEILPQLKRDGAYLQKHNMILLNGPDGDPHGRSVNWNAISARDFPYRIRQVPGPDNPLGVAKLDMVNGFDVYLHDTPGKAAFGRSERNLSHGCIRVEQILPLATLALSANFMPDAETLTAAIASGKTQTIKLPQPLPVYALYWTAIARADGTVHFRPDVYGRDKSLLAALRARSAGEAVAFYLGDCQTFG